MKKRKNILPFSTLGKIIQINTGKRISSEAKITAAKVLEEVCERICKKAQNLSEHRGKKVVQAQDIILAHQQLKEKL